MSITGSTCTRRGCKKRDRENSIRTQPTIQWVVHSTTSTAGPPGVSPPLTCGPSEGEVLWTVVLCGLAVSVECE